MARRRVILGFAAALCACSRSPAPVTERQTPATLAELPTTDGAIAAGNLNSQIAGFSRIIDRGAPDLGSLDKLAGLYLTRAQFFGAVSDLTRARDLAERAVRDFSTDPRAHVLRARTRAALHEFDGALVDLDRAGADVDLQLRAGVLTALGQREEALALLDRRVGLEDTWSIGTRAALLGDLGRFDEARREFVRAQSAMRDTSPFPLAWIYLQEGLMNERAGDPKRARALYAAALERLPGYAAVVAHHATLLPLADGIKLLRPLADTSEDPTYAGELAGLLRMVGTSTASREADALASRAAESFERLLAQHPAAYADHAARFWLRIVGDAQRALAPAESNLGQRSTPEALELALLAAVESKDGAASCRIARRSTEIGARGRAIEHLTRMAERLCQSTSTATR